MGTLATIGIAFGKKVPVRGLIELQAHLKLDDFSLGCLSSAGCRSIVGKVLDRKELDVDEIAFLLSEVSFPTLLKLIELRPSQRDEVRVRPSPLVSLPLAQWLGRFGLNRARALALGFLGRMPRTSGAQVVIDKLDFGMCDEGLLDLVGAITAFRRDLQFVGPSPREIFSWVSATNTNARRGRLFALFEQTIARLQQHGIYRLQACTSQDTLLLVHAVGFPNCLVTDLSVCNAPERLAQELFRINELSGSHGIIDVWVPAIGVPGIGSTGVGARGSGVPGSSAGPSSVLHDLRILRALAVGSICLTNIPFRRASSRRLSLEGMNFSRYCGANDFGFGAIDRGTSDTLNLQPLDKLVQALG